MSEIQQPNASGSRPITVRTRGRSHGPITRLVSPSDLGELIKPFVFLDFFEMNMSRMGPPPLHPHSGIGTVTVVTQGEMCFDTPASGPGSITYGGLEWLRAGGGVWHGNEMAPGSSEFNQGFQLWVALPPELENAPPQEQFIEARQTPQIGPARVMVGQYAGAKSPVQAPEGITYLLVTLKAGENWTFTPPAGQDIAFIAVAEGALNAGEPVSKAEMVVFARGEQPIALQAGPHGVTFVLGAAVVHPYDLVLGHYSVHTTPAALRAGEARIVELRPR